MSESIPREQWAQFRPHRERGSGDSQIIGYFFLERWIVNSGPLFNFFCLKAGCGKEGAVRSWVPKEARAQVKLGAINFEKEESNT